MESMELVEACKAYLKSINNKLNYVTPGELRVMLRERPDSLFILDNRTPEAYQRGHIPGAVNIWLKDVLDDGNIDQLPRDKKIVVCCWVGHTASQLMSLLGVLGYDVVGLKYGMGEPVDPDEPKLGWDELGFPTER